MGLFCKESCLSGTWSYSEIIGSTVFVRAASCGDFFSNISDEEMTVEEVYFKVSIDGKAIPVLKLSGIQDRLYSFREVEFQNINQSPTVTAVCGGFLCGTALVGYGVDSAGTSDTPGGLALIDENGNIIKDRYIRIKSSDVEDPETDDDLITDIDVSIKGNVLD